MPSLATASRTHSVTACASATRYPGNVVGLQIHPPTRDRRLVEIVRGVDTSDDTVATAAAVVDRLGGRAVVCGDRAGRVLNSLLVPFLNDAVKMVEAGYATVDDVDAAMKLGCGYPRGPIEALDEIGLDVALAVQRALHQDSAEPGLAPAPMLDRFVTAGRLGRRSGRGFRDHGEA